MYRQANASDANKAAQHGRIHATSRQSETLQGGAANFVAGVIAICKCALCITARLEHQTAASSSVIMHMSSPVLVVVLEKDHLQQ